MDERSALDPVVGDRAPGRDERAVFAFWRVALDDPACGARRSAPLRSVRALIWRDPGDVEQLDLAAGPGRAGRARRSRRFSSSKNTSTGRSRVVSVRDARGATWRVKWGDEVQVGDARDAAGVGRRLLRRDRPTTFARAASTALRRCSAPRTSLDDDGRFRARAIRARRSRRHQALRRAQLGVERQPVCRHARAERPEDRDDVALELGREGRARRRARVEHGDLRVSPAADGAARGALSDHRLGWRARPVGQHRRAAGAGIARGSPPKARRLWPAWKATSCGSAIQGNGPRTSPMASASPMSDG